MNIDFFGRNTVKEKLLELQKTKADVSIYTLYVRHSDKKNIAIDIVNLANQIGVIVNMLDKKQFDAQYNKLSHQGVVLHKSDITSQNFTKSEDKSYNIIDEQTFFDKLDKLSHSIILILDGIKDVGNLGAIIRSALLFNVDYLVLPKDNCAMLNEVAAKRSAGAAFKLPIVYVTNITRTIEQLKDAEFWIYAADMNGDKIDEINFASKTALVMGEEGHGVRRLVKEKADVVASIPTNDKLDSLNVSVSTAVILYEINRQFNKGIK